ncbi:MAG: PAAR domain-containing protein [Desulfobacterales bacterium]|nr:PAAR domain-containing protein [Desulfobacterales bacterium]
MEGGRPCAHRRRCRGRRGRLSDPRPDGEMTMARPQARLGDISSHGGVIVTGALRTVVNGRPAARLGDLHVCPIPGHGVTPIVTGSLDTATEGLPNARIGDITACGAIIVTGSLNTNND